MTNPPQALFYATLPPWLVVIIAVLVLLTLAWAICITADKSLKRDHDRHNKETTEHEHEQNSPRK